MRVVKLPARPDCQANTGMRFTDRSTTGKCLHTASYQINGKHYCAKHAQIMALEYYLRETLKAPKPGEKV